MDNQVFRQKSLDQISSPEQLNDYMRVTNPSVWIVLAAVILLLAGMILWSSVASIDSFATGTAQVKDGTMTVRFENAQIAKSISSGMEVVVGETASVINSVGKDENGGVFATASTTLTDGVYTAKVIYKNTKVLKLLFN